MKPATCKKIVFRDTHAELIDAGLRPIQSNELLIKAVTSMISPGTERAALTRVWNDAWFRDNPGYSLAGEVVEAGDAVKDIKAGDRVYSLINHASYTIVAADPWATLRIPDKVSNEEAGFVALASVALHGIHRAKIEFGDVVVIIGAGILGQILTQLAGMNGASRVIVIDTIDSRLDLARSYGASAAINPSTQDAIREVFALTHGEGAPVIFEATGNAKVIPLALKLAALGGRVCCLGLMEEPYPIAFHPEFISRELTLIAAHQPHCPTSENIYWRWTQQENRRLVLEMLAERRLRVCEMMTHRFPASQAPEVYEQIKAGSPNMLGVFLEW